MPPVLVAIALALCGADCRDGTCRTLQSYFECVFDGHGGGGGGNTIASALCNGGIQIVVRASFQLASVNSSKPLVFKSRFPQRAEDEDIFFFNREEALRSLWTAYRRGHFNTDKARFVAKALLHGLSNDARPYRRWIAKGEVELEQRWQEQAVWQTQHAFEVASPAAACEFCLRVPVRLYTWDSENEGFSRHNVDSPHTVHVSVMQKVMPLDLERSMTLLDLKS